MPRPCVPIKTHRARQKKGAQQVGHSRSGASTKVHAVVDALGNPVRLKLTEGQAHEMTVALELVDGLRNADVAADKAYDSQALITQLERNGCRALIPSNRRGSTSERPRRPIDGHAYRARHLVENFFQRIKRFRRIAIRYDKLGRTFLAFLHLVSVLIWLL